MAEIIEEIPEDLLSRHDMVYGTAALFALVKAQKALEVNHFLVVPWTLRGSDEHISALERELDFHKACRQAGLQKHKLDD